MEDHVQSIRNDTSVLSHNSIWDVLVALSNQISISKNSYLINIFKNIKSIAHHFERKITHKEYQPSIN